jgi:hypothetical protein
MDITVGRWVNNVSDTMWKEVSRGLLHDGREGMRKTVKDLTQAANPRRRIEPWTIHT